MPQTAEMDWLLQSLLSPLTLFDNLTAFEGVLQRCKRKGYIVNSYDCREYSTANEICNVILHAVGVIDPDWWYAGLNLDGFNDLMLTPDAGEAPGVVLGFSHFDTFVKNDPEAAQFIVETLMAHSRASFAEDSPFLILAHCESRELPIKWEVELHASENYITDFSEQADLDDDIKTRRLHWYRDVKRALNERITPRYTEGDIEMALRDFHRMASDYLGELPSLEEGVRLTREYVERRDAAYQTNSNYAGERWLDAITAILQPVSPVQLSPVQPDRSMVVAMLYKHYNLNLPAPRPDKATPEEAATYLLGLDVAEWDDVGEGTSFVRTADRKGRVSELDHLSPAERRGSWNKAMLPAWGDPYDPPLDKNRRLRPYDMDWLLKQLLQPVTLFNEESVFDSALERCRRKGYTLHEFDCRQFKSQEEIYNAVLHEVGGQSKDSWYKNIKHIQFWDLLYVSHFGAERAEVIALRHFETFYAIDPECGQTLLEILAGQHMRNIRSGNRLLNLVHCEGERLPLQSVLTSKARWNRVTDFSEQADRDREKGAITSAWTRQVYEQALAEGIPVPNDFSVSKALCEAFQMDLKAWPDLIDLDIPMEEAVRLVGEYVVIEVERRRVWREKWDAVGKWIRQIEYHFEDNYGPLVFPDMTLTQLFSKTGIPERDVSSLMNLNLSHEAAAQMILESEEELALQSMYQQAYLKGKWLREVAHLVRAQTQVALRTGPLLALLEQVAQANGQPLMDYKNATPEEAAKWVAEFDLEEVQAQGDAPRYRNRRWLQDVAYRVRETTRQRIGPMKLLTALDHLERMNRELELDEATPEEAAKELLKLERHWLVEG